MKKHPVVFLILIIYLLSIPLTSVIAEDTDAQFSKPLSKATMKKSSNIYWGKNEAFPVMGIAFFNQQFDVYEYNKEWVMILYDTYLTQGSNGKPHSFFGYVKRSDTTCDPELDGDESKKAETGLGKKKGKKPKTPKQDNKSDSEDVADPEDNDTSDDSDDPDDDNDSNDDESAPDEDVDIEISDEDYDWIIRTPGLCTVTIPVEQSNFHCSFSLIAQKAGGIGPSSDSGFNHGIRTPYAATAFFSMVSPMQETLQNSGISNILSGSGGVEIIGQAAGATFFIDTASLDPALVNFNISLNATATLDPKITDGNITGSLGISVAQVFPLPVQLKKSGESYKFVLKGMKPGGGDLEFPAILEKTFSDEDRWDKAAKDADRKRAEAEKIRKKILEKIKKQVQDEWSKQTTPQKETESTEPLPELAPLEPLKPDSTDNDSTKPEEEFELAPLEPLKPDDTDTKGDTTSNGTEEDPVLAPLWPLTDEAVNDFPSK